MVRIRNYILFPALMMLIAACDMTPEQGIARGEELFDTCAPCHGTDGGGNQVLRAPAIAGLPQWYLVASLEKYENGWRGEHPQDTVGIRMRSMAKSLDLVGDRGSVAEYVASMPQVMAAASLETGDAQAGQGAFLVCAVCHGADGNGNEQLGGPPLVGQHDWYLLSQMHNFKSGLRGTNPNDVSGATMRPNSLLLDDTAMENIVAYIQTLQ